MIFTKKSKTKNKVISSSNFNLFWRLNCFRPSAMKGRFTTKTRRCREFCLPMRSFAGQSQSHQPHPSSSLTPQNQIEIPQNQIKPASNKQFPPRNLPPLTSVKPDFLFYSTSPSVLGIRIKILKMGFLCMRSMFSACFLSCITYFSSSQQLKELKA